MNGGIGMGKDALVILGAGGHGKVVADIAVRTGRYRTISFLDDAGPGQCMGLPVAHGCEGAFGLAATHEVFVAIGDSGVRRRLMEALADRGAEIAALVHPDVVVGRGAVIGAGTVVMAGVVLNPDCRIGRGCIVNTCASVDHDCRIGDYVHVSVGARVTGSVTVGAGTWIGAGAVVNNGLRIAGSCTIGSGAVVVDDIEEAGTYVGVPARRIGTGEDRGAAGDVPEVSGGSPAG